MTSLHRTRNDEITVIDADEYEAACRDPKVISFLEESRQYVERLRREGRDHTGWGSRGSASANPTCSTCNPYPGDPCVCGWIHLCACDTRC